MSAAAAADEACAPASDALRMNCDLVGCSIDSEFVHLAWTNTPRNQGGIGKLKFPLLADVNHKICQVTLHAQRAFHVPG